MSIPLNHSPRKVVVDAQTKKVTSPLYLALTIAGLMMGTSAQAFLPTPVTVVTTGELAFSPELDTINALANTATNSATKSTADSYSASMTNMQSLPNGYIDKTLKGERLLAQWRKQARADNLAQHTTWRRLLYFLDDKKTLFSKGASTSLIDNPSFFLSTEGQRDSGAELDAMLVAFAHELTVPQTTTGQNKAAQTTAASNYSAICRFPARTQWLKQALGIDDALLQVDCPELEAWMTMLAPEQLSIMFAEEYLDNPISAFAHTLLRIDSKASVDNPNQISHAYALNDTVDGNPDDAFAVYAIKATSGGYNNRIEIDLYPEKLAKYLQDDERDAWTYQLDLTPAEVRQIILHVWETKDLDIPYYFATDNCASEILRLIDVVRPQQRLLSRLPYAVVPADVVQLLNEEQLLIEGHYTPADDTVRQAQLNRAVAQSKAQDTVGEAILSKEDFNKLKNEIKSHKRNLASAMSADGSSLLTLPIEASDNNPIDRHPLQMAHIGIGQRADNAYLDIGVRAGFHDTLDRSSGYGQFFNLEGLAATLRVYDTDNSNSNEPSSVVLDNFTLLRGRSFNPINTAKKGQTWGASVEATRVNDGSQTEYSDHLVGSVAYERGWSWAFGSAKANTGEMPPQLCYALAVGTAQAGRGINKGFRVGAGMNAGCQYQINNQLRAQAELQLPYWYHGSSDESNVRSHYWQPISTLGLQYDIDIKQAIRLEASYEWQDRIEADDDIKLSYSRYF